jgi:peptidoglycan DL-endopeptidase CwlO
VTSRCNHARRAISIRPFLRWVALTAMSLGLTAALVAGSGHQAQAEPPLTVAEAKALIAQLETDASAIDQDYVEISDQLNKGRAKLKLKQDDLKAQAQEVEKLRFQVGQVALAKFQNRNLDTAAQLFVTPDTEGFLSQISTVEKVSENQNSVLQTYQQKQAETAALELSAKTDLAALAEQEKQLKALRTASDKKIAESKKVLAKLTSEERRRIAAEERRAAASARAEAESSSNSESEPTRTRARAKATSTAEKEDDAPAATGGGSGSKGARALAYARAQLGDPYQFAAAGPNAFDCSGLTSAAWKSVGVSLPRSSRSQYSAGTSVSRSNLQPGDLVFFYSPISHVALYAGNGQIIHAPRPGKSVEYSSMSYMPYTGARRPG